MVRQNAGGIESNGEKPKGISADGNGAPSRPLVADPVLQLPDAKRGEEEALGPAESAHSRQLFNGGILNGILPRAAPAPFGFADATCSLANWEMTGVVHGLPKSSFQASGPGGE